MADRPSGVGFGSTPGQTGAGGAESASAGGAAPDPERPERARIVVNGQPREIPAGLALPALLVELGLRPGSVVVELRGQALTPSEATGVHLADGDTLEIVRAVAGG